MRYKVDKNGNCRHPNGCYMSNREVTALLLEGNDAVRRRAFGAGVWRGVSLTWAGLLLGSGSTFFLRFTEPGQRLLVFVEKVVALWSS